MEQKDDAVLIWLHHLPVRLPVPLPPLKPLGHQKPLWRFWNTSPINIAAGDVAEAKALPAACSRD